MRGDHSGPRRVETSLVSRRFDAFVTDVMPVQRFARGGREDQVFCPGAAVRELISAVLTKLPVKGWEERDSPSARLRFRSLEVSVLFELMANVEFVVLEVHVLPA